MDTKAANTPLRTFKWYHIALVVTIGACLLACAGLGIFLSTSPAVNQALRSAGQSLGVLVALQQKIAKQFALDPNQVGVRVNTAFARGTSDTTTSTTTLVISLVNSNFNALPATDTYVKTRQVAVFAHGNFPSGQTINQYCVQLVHSTQVLFFTSGQSEDYCFKATEL